MSEVVYNFYFEQLIKKIVKPYLRFLPITIHFFAVGVFASVVPNFGGIVVNMNLAEGFVRLFFCLFFFMPITKLYPALY